MNFCKIAIVNYDRNWWPIIHFLFKFYKPVFGLLTRSSAPVIITNKVSELHFLRSPEWFPRFDTPVPFFPVSAPSPVKGFCKL